LKQEVEKKKYVSVVHYLAGNQPDSPVRRFWPCVDLLHATEVIQDRKRICDALGGRRDEVGWGVSHATITLYDVVRKMP
jgi:hypothetical protein